MFPVNLLDHRLAVAQAPGDFIQRRSIQKTQTHLLQIQAYSPLEGSGKDRPMYIPKQFAENDLTILQAAIKSLQFATIITLNDTSLSASHIPMLIDDTAGKYGTLEGHIARANPQWNSYAKAVPALAIFTGPNAYISPSWYATKKEHGKAVPTWNYIAVHASGPLEIVEDRNWLLDHVNRLTNRNE